MLRTLEPQNKVKNKNAEAHFKKQCSYKMKSVYFVTFWSLAWFITQNLATHVSPRLNQAGK